MPSVKAAGVEAPAGEQKGVWWHQPTTFSADLERASAPASVEWYRIGDGYLGVASEDEPFRARLQLLFRECAVPGPELALLPQVRCTVRLSPPAGAGLVTFEDPEPLDLREFTLTVFPDRAYRPGGETGDGWRSLEIPGPAGPRQVAMDPGGGRLLVPLDSPWQALAGNLAVSRLLRLQRGVLFLHAGSVDLGGRGVLLVGGKGSGKTTLTLALAARGYPFLGDEIAAVRTESRELIPVRRSLAVREGPGADSVGLALTRAAAPYEAFPDGTRRRRAYADQLFPGGSLGGVRLSDVVFLCGFGPSPRLEPMGPGREQLSWLTPLGATLWQGGPARVRQLMNLLTGSRCWRLHVGPPDATADLLATLGEK